MLYKKKLAKLMITAVVCATMNNTLVFAVDEVNTDDTSVMKVTDEKDTTKVTDAEYASIEKILEYINKEIKSIDEKIESTKTLNEYEQYPGVRLNIDTPYFGITSIISSKLRIRDNVSTVDVANGYNIRNVVNKKIIKIESFEVSNIVVITRDVKIDKNMTSADAKVCIFKLLDYLEQTKSVNKFLDKQLISMVKPFFAKEKLEAIDKINVQIKEIDENLSNSLSELSYISATTDIDINSDVNTLYQYKLDMTAIKTKIKSIFISKARLDEIYDITVKMNKEIKTFESNVNKKYLEVANNIDLEKAVYLINSKMANELNYLQGYLDNSKVEIVSETTTTEQAKVDTDTTLNSDQAAIQNKAKEYKEIYKIASEAIIQNMIKDMDRANEILDKVVKYNLAIAEQLETQTNTTQTEVAQAQTIEKIDAKATINELLKVYIAFLNKENVFLTENAKVNITAIKTLDVKKINSFEDIEYIYVNLSDILTNISDKFESSSTISNIKTSESLKKVITKVIASSKNFKTEEVKVP